MRRRTFLQMLGAAMGLGLAPLNKSPRALAQARYDGLRYSDSEGTGPAALASLGDGITSDGGVAYAA